MDRHFNPLPIGVVRLKLAMVRSSPKPARRPEEVGRWT